jgi:predicted nuclease with TOPRIM domain
LFAIAFAIDHLLGEDISKLVYDQSQMREFLKDCLIKGELKSFPKKRQVQGNRPEIHDKFQGEWMSQSKPQRLRRSKRLETSQVKIENQLSALNPENQKLQTGQPNEKETENKTSGIRQYV